MKAIRLGALLAGLSGMASGIAGAQTPCGGSFGSFVNDVKREAMAAGHSRATVDGFFATVEQSQSVLKADRSQGVFHFFVAFSQKLISGYRMDKGRAYARDMDALFARIERETGVSRGVLIAFWAFETDFAGIRDFNTRNALATLAHDCRRPELFRPQVFNAIDLYADVDPDNTTAPGPVKSGKCRCCPGISSPTAATAMVMGASI